MRKPDIDLGRLTMAMQRSRLMLRRPREERREAVRQYVGAHWTGDGSFKKVPVNLLALYVSIIARSLFPKEPRLMLSSFDRTLKPVLTAMEAWANQTLPKMEFADTIGRIVVDSLFSIGIAKVALATPADTAHFAWNIQPARPFVEPVDLDDFVFDINARKFSECAYMGHRYRVPLASIKDDRMYSKARKTLTASTDSIYNREGDERIGALGRGTWGTNTMEVEDMVDLWEIYLPRHRLVLTLPDDAQLGPTGGEDLEDALRVQKWVGPDSGMYHILGMQPVPGNPLPKAPVQDLIDLHEFVNETYRKLMRQTQRQKEVLPIRGGATEDGGRLVQSNDGEEFRCDNEAPKPVNYGGPDQKCFAVFESARNLFSYMGENLEMQGGLSPQSKTATQDRLLAGAASGGMQDKQDRTIAFVSGVLRALCWYWWKDPYHVMTVSHSAPGAPEISMTREVHPGSHMDPDALKRRGRFEDLDIRVDPYSLQHSTPQARLQKLQEVVRQDMIPLLPLLQQQGIGFDINAYLEKVGRYLDEPDIADITTIAQPLDQSSQQGPDTGPKPAQTERTYTRENVPARTPQGDSQNRINKLMGVNPGGAPEANGAMAGA